MSGSYKWRLILFLTEYEMKAWRRIDAGRAADGEKENIIGDC